MMANSACSSQANVVLLGHSYINRLRKYVCASETLSNFELRTVNVKFVCKGGMTLRPRLRRERYTREIGNFVTEVGFCYPDYVILHIGENDVQCTSKEEIALDILDFVNRLSHWCNCAVYVLELIAWPSHTRETAIDIQMINDHLKHSLPPRHFWEHRAGLTLPEVFLPDNIHLNKKGMVKYYKSVRTLIGRSVYHHCH